MSAVCAAPDGSRSRGAARVFLVAFLGFFVACATWSYATPLLAAPDEPVHIVKAAAVVRGELLGNLARGPESPFGLVQVPAFYAMLRSPAEDPAHSFICFHTRPTVPASCAASIDTPPARYEARASEPGAPPVATEAWVYNARYPPLYYAIVGLPTLLGGSSGVLYLMRLVSGAVSSLFLALGATLALRRGRNRLLLLGPLVALTPMVLFLASVVNPSGLEISAAFAAWTSGILLVTEAGDAPVDSALLSGFAVSAVVFELVRSLSPVWLALTVVVLAALASRDALARLAASGRARHVGALVALVALVALAWTVHEHATLVYAPAGAGVGRTVSELTILETSFDHTTYYLADMIGVFGWFDTDSPVMTYVIWWAVVGVVTVLAAAVASRRQRAVLGLFAVAIVVIPVAISSSQARVDGYVWSGRDTLPFAIGLPLVAAALLSRSRLGGAVSARALAGCVALLAFSAQLGAFFEAMRRYAVGTDGPDFGFLVHASWHAPLPFVVLLVVFALATGSLYVLGVRFVGQDLSAADDGSGARGARGPSEPDSDGTPG